jgi:hypothetical protein
LVRHRQGNSEERGCFQFNMMWRTNFKSISPSKLHVGTMAYLKVRRGEATPEFYCTIHGTCISSKEFRVNLGILAKIEFNRVAPTRCQVIRGIFTTCLAPSIIFLILDDSSGDFTTSVSIILPNCFFYEQFAFHGIWVLYLFQKQFI